MIEEAPLHNALAEGPEGGTGWWLRASDGVRLRLGVWRQEPARGTVFLLPGRTEYIEKYGPAAADFAARGYAMVTVDWRGQGLADRLCADPLLGHVGRFADYQRDLDAVLDAAARLSLPRPWFLLGHSMGGAIGLRRLLGTHPFAACAFSAPMWGMVLPFGLQPVGPLVAQVLGRFPPAMRYAPGQSPITYLHRAAFHDNLLTSDARMWAFMLNHLAQLPQLALAGPSLHWVAEAILECQSLAAEPAPDLPCHCALGGHERIVHTASVRAQMARWPKGELAIHAGAEHELMMETPAHRARFYDACAALFAATER